MDLKFECPHCQQHILATSDQSGLEAACPGCNETITVPEVGAEPTRSPLITGRATPSSAPESRGKWLPTYVVGSSALILVLLCVLIFRGPSAPVQTSHGVGSAHSDVLGDAKGVTAELEKQRQAQEELIGRQKVADDQRRIAEAQSQAAEGKRRQEEAAQRKAEQERATLEARRNAALARMEGLERQLSVVRLSQAETLAEQEAYTTKVKEYAMEHKMAIAALGVTVGGGAVALDGSNKFNRDQKALAGGAAVLGGLYAITHHGECIAVADTMAKVAAIQSDYNDRIKSSQEKASSLQAQIADLKRSLP